MFYVLMAFKNLVRHKKRTIITASALAIGIMAFLFMESILMGTEFESVRNIVWYETSSARVFSPAGAENWKKLSLKDPLEQVGPVLQTLREAGYQATARATFQAEISWYDSTKDEVYGSYVRAVALDPQHDAEVFPRAGIKLQGTWPQAGQYQVVLGQWLAEDLGAGIGSAISLNTRTRAGSYQVLDLVVVGLMDTPNPIVNRNTVYLPLDVASEELDMGLAVGDIAISFPLDRDAVNEAQSIQEVLAKKLPGGDFRVLSWNHMASDFLALAGAKTKGSSSILFLVFIIAAVGISNTLLMAFFERRNEIGMLRAIGMADRTLFWTFILEAAAIGLLGSAIGVVLGLGVVWWASAIGVDLGFLLRQTDIGYRISGIMRGLFMPASFVKALFLGTILAALTAILPTRRALRMGITDALRVE